MKVMFHAGSSATAQVHSNIKAIGLIGLLQSNLTTLDQFQHFCRLFLRRLLKICVVGVGGNQEVHGGVGKDVEDNEAQPTPKDNKIPFVVLTRGIQAEYATAWILKAGNVLIPPGSP